LEAIDQKMEEEDMVVITLKILPRAYEHFIETLNITATDVDLKFGELCNKLLQQDRWKKQFGSKNRPLQPMSREKANGQRRTVRAMVRMQPRA
jgi:hypothetical protein